MQLFICDFTRDTESSSIVMIDETRVVYQCRTVLRMSVGSVFCIQSFDGIERYEVVIDLMKKKALHCSIRQSFLLDNKKWQTEKDLFSLVTLCVALPNTGKKLSFLVQKLTELGVGSIVFWSADRSQLSDVSEQKLGKLSLVALEATEQSRGRFLPVISYQKKISDVFAGQSQVVVFDNKSLFAPEISLENKLSFESTIAGIVGPEGGLSVKDYDQIALGWQGSLSVFGLGSQVLRMETAAIVGAWRLVNADSYCNN